MLLINILLIAFADTRINKLIINKIVVERIVANILIVNIFVVDKKIVNWIVIVQRCFDIN